MVLGLNGLGFPGKEFQESATLLPAEKCLESDSRPHSTFKRETCKEVLPKRDGQVLFCRWLESCRLED